ncbi:MAG: hypothetical protein OHK0032_10750 [Thermodesulfovibrionales bacterium]
MVVKRIKPAKGKKTGTKKGQAQEKRSLKEAPKKALKPVKKTLRREVKGKLTKIKTGVKMVGQKKTSKEKSTALERLELLRRQLIQRREEIVKEAKIEIGKYIKGEAKQLVETALDDGDWSVIDLSEDINLKRLETHRDSLRNIDEALRKLKEGTYGICEDCGEEISVERLKVLPFAVLCRDCQEKKEVMERIEREEII